MSELSNAFDAFDPAALARGDTFHTRDVARRLDEVHERICLHKHRVALRRDGCDDVVVLMSKVELDGLEHALDILMRLPDAQAMHQDVIKIAKSAMDSYRARRTAQ